MLTKQTVSEQFIHFFWRQPKQDLLHLIFPSKCILCSGEWPSNEPICSFCYEELQFTGFENYTEPTELDTLFWGRVQLKSSFALLYFNQNSSTQKILHALKYQNKPEAGRILGKEIGLRLRKRADFNDVDVIVPVPLHPKKQFVRGYNQSEELAKGVSEITGIALDKTFIGKLKHTGSQTKQGRFGRWDNVATNFSVNNKRTNYKHLMIVDDVITTGATLEAMILSIHEVLPELKISIVSLALTK